MGMALTNDRIFLRAIMTGDSGMIRQVVQDVEDRPGVYCIFNSESNMLYIGCSNNIRTRIVTHKRHMSNGEHICKQMSADYVMKPDAFVFFPLEYIDFDDYNSVELHRTILLNRETQYMKRVPHTRLYNNSIPVSMSEKLLMSDIPADKLKVHVSDIFRRLEMSPDSIRANGYSIQDELTLPEAVEFVRKRTVANGRWPQEKADLAIAYLAELESQTRFDSDSNNDLVAGSRFDYFGDYVVQKPQARESRFSIPVFGLSGLLSVVIYAHTALVWYEVALIFGMPGIFAGVILAALKHAAVVASKNPDYDRFTADTLGVAFVLDALAVYAHYTAFREALPGNFAQQMGDGGSFWAACVLAVVVASGAFMSLYFINEIRKTK